MKSTPQNECHEMNAMKNSPSHTTPPSKTDAASRYLASRAAIYQQSKGKARLLVVSKGHGAAALRTLYNSAGASAFGENYLEEALEKQACLKDLPLEWHYIGALQSRACEQIGAHFDWVHTLSREKEIPRLAKGRASRGGVLEACIQVKFTEGEHRGGVPPNLDSILALAKASAGTPLRVRGLMTLASTDSPDSDFARLAALFAALKETHFPKWDTLSMGMSGDFEKAVAAGSTLVRIGTAILGARH